MLRLTHGFIDNVNVDCLQHCWHVIRAEVARVVGTPSYHGDCRTRYGRIWRRRRLQKGKQADGLHHFGAGSTVVELEQRHIVSKGNRVPLWMQDDPLERHLSRAIAAWCVATEEIVRANQHRIVRRPWQVLLKAVSCCDCPISSNKGGSTLVSKTPAIARAHQIIGQQRGEIGIAAWVDRCATDNQTAAHCGYDRDARIQDSLRQDRLVLKIVTII